jgi:hypothetical protein
MPAPIALSDSQLDAIVRAAAPLAPADRAKFLEAVAEALRGRVIGDGTVYLAIAEAQRKYFAPPVLEKAAGSRTKIPPRGGESRRHLLRQDVVRGAEEN